MRRRSFLVGISLWAAAGAALAQAKEKSLRVGLIAYGDGKLEDGFQRALVEGLRERGYVEGRNLVIERRYASGVGERVPRHAAELAGLGLDAIVTTCGPTTLYASKATSTVPLVMAGVADPLGQGLIASYARPGRNITGVASQFEDLAPKMLQLLVSGVSNASPVAVAFHPNNGVHKKFLAQIHATARELKVAVAPAAVTAKTDLASLFQSFSRDRVGSLMVLPDDPPLANLRRPIIALAAKHRLPTFFGLQEAVQDGALMSYGQPLAQAYFRAAYYVDRIAKGSQPAELSVEQPTKFELAINLRTAKALGITIPQSVALRADRLIE